MRSDVERWVKDADDRDLQEWIERAQGELRVRGDRRKHQARETAQAILARAADEACSVLERVGLPFEPGKPRRVRKTKPAYRAGQLYAHPDKSTLRWNGKGVRPSWVKELERAGRSPEFIQAIDATAPERG